MRGSVNLVLCASYIDAGCPVCRADISHITMVMRLFSYMTDYMPKYTGDIQYI